VKARFEALARPFCSIDTDRATEANLQAILSYLSTGLATATGAS